MKKKKFLSLQKRARGEVQSVKPRTRKTQSSVISKSRAGIYNYKYNGKELQETGMYDYGARMYMPDIGRWGVVDKLSEIAQSWSPYRYAYDNPIQYYDPTGLIEEGGPGDPKKKGEIRTQNIEEVVITKYTALARAPNPTFGDHLQQLRNSPQTPSYGAGNGLMFLSNIVQNILLDTGNALKNFVGSDRYQGGPAGEQWTRLDGFPMGGEEQQTQAVNMLIMLFGGQFGLAAEASVPSSQFSASTIDDAVNLVMKDPNKISHLFDPKHDLSGLVQKFGGQENTVRAVLNAADGKLPASGIFKDIPVNVGGQNILIRGNVINGIPRLGTIFTPK